MESLEETHTDKWTMGKTPYRQQTKLRIKIRTLELRQTEPIPGDFRQEAGNRQKVINLLQGLHRGTNSHSHSSSHL